MDKAIRTALTVVAMITAIGLSALGMETSAQGACPEGQVMVGATQGGQGIASTPICQVPYEAPYKAPHPLTTRDPATFNDRTWGAIVEAGDGSFHTSFGQLDKKSAVAEANAACRQHGAGPCRLTSTPRNNYVAVTRHDNKNYYGSYVFPRGAVEQAQKKCRKADGTECGVTFMFFSNKGLVDLQPPRKPLPPGAGEALREFARDHAPPDAGD